MEEKQKGPGGKQTGGLRGGQAIGGTPPLQDSASLEPVTKGDFFFRHVPSTMTERCAANTTSETGRRVDIQNNQPRQY
ncbi:hypothetical protein K0M31_011923 [Melipona bicolor]|uniref:Uncharacterized protein n=1 Tax=Melipona bicolor TaxID=60889 RepID=A0AA40GBA4_9HYME|nr:hypothetical protein K0M31_011923 [Melipona bicolor]